MSNALIFPVGHYLGANHPGEQHIVRIGWQQYELNAGDELAVWALAHGVPGADDAPWTRSTAEAVARVRDAAGAGDGLGAVPANPTARVDGFSYELWTWGHACDSLWQTCEYVAHAEAGAGTAESTLDRVLPAVQLLLANGAAYLDESRDD